MVDFFASADAYDRFMGRFSTPLARQFIDLVSPEMGGTALDVGSGPGALSQLLVEKLGAANVSAVDPSEGFVVALRHRLPGVSALVGSVESLPFPGGYFDLTVAQLVMHFVADPIGGVTEMLRVTRASGTVAANVWDFAGGRGPLGVFERACLDLDPTAPTERIGPGTADGGLATIFEKAGLRDIRSTELTVRVEFATFDAWWEPFTFGVGPAGAYVASLDDDHRSALAAHARELLPDGAFGIDATAWTVIGRA